MRPRCRNSTAQLPARTRQPPADPAADHARATPTACRRAAAPPRRRPPAIPPWRTASSVVPVSSEFYHQPHTLLFLSPAASSLSSTLPRVASSLPAAACCPPPTAPCVSTSTRPFCGPFPAHCTLLHAPPDTRPHLVRWMDPQRVGCSPLAATCGRNRALTLPHPHVAGRHRTLPTEPPHRYAARIHVSRRCRCLGCSTAAASGGSCVHSWVSADTGGGNADGRLSGGSISGVRRRVTRLARWTDPHRVGCSPLAATWWGEI